MQYLSVIETAQKWNVSERSVRNYCAHGCSLKYNIVTRLYNVDVFASDCSFIDSETTPYLFFIYCFLKENKANLDVLQKGAAQPHVYAKDINSMKLVIPTEDKLKVYCKIVSKYFDKIRALQG